MGACKQHKMLTVKNIKLDGGGIRRIQTCELCLWTTADIVLKRRPKNDIASYFRVKGQAVGS